MTLANFLHQCFASVDLELDIRMNDRYPVVFTSLDANSGGGDGETL